MKTMKKLLAAFLCALMLLSVFVFQGSAVKVDVGKPKNLKGTSTMYSVTLTWEKNSLFDVAIYQQKGGNWKQIKWIDNSFSYSVSEYSFTPSEFEIICFSLITFPAPS